MSAWSFLPDELLIVDDRLTNWGRWAFDRARPGRARSAEGRYRVPSVADDESRKPGRLVDQNDALRVGRALGALPSRELQILKDHYVDRLPEHVVRFRARIPSREWQGAVRYAMFMARNVLRREDSRKADGGLAVRRGL